MTKSRQRWLIAILLFLLSAVYQRMTGPTHPVRGSIVFGSETISYKLERNHGGESDHRVEVSVVDTAITGTLSCRRLKTDQPWTYLSMHREDEALVGFLPHQPPAGKLQYRITLEYGGESITVPPGAPVVIRFKGAVPTPILVAHIVFMALAMILSNRAGLEALARGGQTRRLTLWTIGTLLVGGLILGPIIQKYAFGALWTGFPFGHDLTDNKTAVAFVFWLVALFAGRRGTRARAWVLAAAVVTLVIYLIPHSLLGSELDYSKV